MSADLTQTELNKSELPQYQEPKEKKHAKSLVVINTGNGRGKSSSAFGIMLRGLARDWKVACVQYMKSGNWKTGEEKMALKLGVDFWHIGEGFTWLSEDISKDAATAQEAWKHSKSLIQSGNYQLIIFDEITYPINYGWIDINEVVETIKNRPLDTSIVLTGRDAPQQLIDVADTVSRIENVKHPFEKGIMAKRGIDY